MDYSIVTRRQIGLHSQTAAVVYKNAPQTATTAQTRMKSFVELFANYKPTTINTGTLEVCGSMRQDGSGTANTGTYSDCVVIFTKVTDDALPEVLQTVFRGLNSSNIDTLIKNYFNEILGNQTYYQKYVITGLNIKLYS